MSTSRSVLSNSWCAGKRLRSSQSGDGIGGTPNGCPFRFCIPEEWSPAVQPPQAGLEVLQFRRILTMRMV